MSHNIMLSGVRYDDLQTLGSVVHDLSKGAARLVKNQKHFRTYPGQPTDCDHCIAMPGRHDIGLRRAKEGHYDMVFDPYAMDQVFSAKNPSGVYQARTGQYMVGAIAQEYLLRVAEIKAAQSGFTTSRIAAKNGAVSLIMEKVA